MNTTAHLRLEIEDGRKFNRWRERWHELSFDPEKDEKLTEGDFHGISRHLRFRARLSGEDLDDRDLPDELLIYLGYNLSDWNEELEIPLHDPSMEDDTYIFTSAAEPPKDKNYKTPALKFRNAYWTVGKLDLTVCTGDREPLCRSDGSLYQTSIRLECNDKAYAELYSHIRQDVQRDGSVVGLTAPIRDNLPTSKTRGIESPALTLYYRLERILPTLEKLLWAVSRKPSTEVALEVQGYSLPHSNAESALASMGAGIKARVRSARSTQSGLVPTRFMAHVPVRTHDTLANRFVRAALEQVLFWLTAVSEQFDEYIGILRKRLKNLEADGKGTPYDFWGRTSGRLLKEASIHVKNAWYKLDQHEQKLRRLNATRERLRGLDALIPSVGTSINALAISTATLAFDPRYSALRKKLQEFAAVLHTPSIPGSDDLEETPIEPFSEIFERWALQRTIDALERLGFQSGSIDNSSYNQLFLNQTYCIPGFELDYENGDRLPAGSRLVLAYGKVYPLFTSGTDDLYGVEDRLERTSTNKRKDAPDIVLEYFDPGEDVPVILVLDASLSSADWTVEDKGKYRDTIRSFNEDEKDGRIKHSKRIVLGSYCVSPVKRGHKLYNSASFHPEDVVMSHKGSLLLPPDRQEASRRVASVIEGVFSGHWL